MIRLKFDRENQDYVSKFTKIRLVNVWNFIRDNSKFFCPIFGMHSTISHYILSKWLISKSSFIFVPHIYSRHLFELPWIQLLFWLWFEFRVPYLKFMIILSVLFAWVMLHKLCRIAKIRDLTYSCFDSTNWLSTQNGAFPFLVDFTGVDAGEGSETLATSWAFPSALVGLNWFEFLYIS